MPSYYFFIALVPSIVLHEVSHGYVANFFGDPTAKEMHRLTLNPMRHIDPFGTVLLPALMLLSGLPAFGYAKPVPVNISRLRRPREQSLYVSLAGPLVNLVLSAIGLMICKFSISGSGQAALITNSTLFNIGEALGLVNLILALFNLLPIPPLDGSAMIERFIPNRHMSQYYALRARAMPFVLIFMILGFYVFHFGSNALVSVENWWFSLIV